jgi:hypothetical protein
MTRDEIKTAIRAGRATPGVTNVLFAECHEEVLREDHPDFTIKVLTESRSHGERLGADGLPENVHARVAALIESSEPRSDLKDDSVANAPRRAAGFASDPQAAVRAAVANFLAHQETHPAAPKKPTPVTLRESYDDLGKRFPDATVTQKASILLFGSA